MMNQYEELHVKRMKRSVNDGHRNASETEMTPEAYAGWLSVYNRGITLEGTWWAYAAGVCIGYLEETQ